MRVSVSAGLIAASAATGVMAAEITQSIRPLIRPELVHQAAAKGTAAVQPELPTPGDAAVQVVKSPEQFQDWITGFRDRAVAQGISAGVLDAAFRGVRYDADVVRRDRNQSEFTKTIWDYLDSAASDTRIRNGKAALERQRATLDAIEARYDVDKHIVVAIWGLESAYGAFRGSSNVIQSLATLAFDGRRGAFFEGELIAALKILQNGDTQPRNMTGSWAGAMGHTQFIPTSYLAHAVDFTGDGRRDIWSDDPSDALASTAAYLAHFGWTKGQPWGVEVRLPEGFDYAAANRDNLKSPTDWAAQGIMDVDGNPVPDHGPASILLPAGVHGAAFMIFDNFAVIERYNTADAYVIGVGHLGDRIIGAGPIRSDWPRGDRALSFDERQEMQRRLTAAGFDTQGIDGKIGPLTIAAVRAFQTSVGMAPDGYASLRLLDRLR